MKKKRSLTTFILPSRFLFFSPSNNSPTTALTMFCWQCNAMQFDEMLLHLVSSSASKFKRPNISCNSISWRSRFLRGGLTICGGWQEARQLRGRRGPPTLQPLAHPTAPSTLAPLYPLLPSLSPSLATHIDRVKGDRSPTRQGEEGKDISKAGIRGNPYPKVLCCPARPFHRGISKPTSYLTTTMMQKKAAAGENVDH